MAANTGQKKKLDALSLNNSEVTVDDIVDHLKLVDYVKNKRVGMWNIFTTDKLIDSTRKMKGRQ